MKKQCDIQQERFVEALYGELSGDALQEFETHLHGCETCAAEFKRLKAMLQTMDQRTRETVDEPFFENYWERLSARMNAENLPEQKTSRLKFPKWGFQISAAAAILLIGIIIGHFWMSTPEQTPPPVAKQNIQREMLQARTTQYLEKSKVLLLGLVNLDTEAHDPETIDLQRFQSVSQQLLREAGALKPVLLKSREQRLGQLVNDLEVILMQIANLESREDVRGIEIIRNGVERQGVLFKINLEEIRRNRPVRLEKKMPSSAI